MDTKCTACGAVMPPAAEGCWLCGQKVELASNSAAAARASPPAAGPLTFSLATLLIVVTGVCVWLGLTVQWPPVGIVVAILAVPAAARAWWYQRAWQKAGQPLTPAQAAFSFVGSLAVMALVAAAGTVAFVGVCFPIGLSQFVYLGPTIEFLFYSAWFWGGVAALLFVGFIVWRLWITAARQLRVTGMPPSGRQRLLAFFHVLFIVLCVFHLGGLLGIGGLAITVRITDWQQKADAVVVIRTIAYFVGLSGFCVGGWAAYRLTRRSLSAAAPWVVACAGAWLGFGVGWAISLELPLASPGVETKVWALWLVSPLVGAAASFWLYRLTAMVLGSATVRRPDAGDAS